MWKAKYFTGENILIYSIITIIQVFENESDGEIGVGGGRPSTRTRPRRVTFAQQHFSHSVTDYYSPSGERQLSERYVHALSIHYHQSYYSIVTIQYYYYCRELKLVGEYLTELASLDHHLHAANKHQTTLNDLIDLVDFTKYWTVDYVNNCGYNNYTYYIIHIIIIIMSKCEQFR